MILMRKKAPCLFIFNKNILIKMAVSCHLWQSGEGESGLSVAVWSFLEALLIDPGTLGTWLAVVLCLPGFYMILS